MATNNRINEWTGWGFFAGLLLTIQGIAQVIMGISELGQKKLFFILPNAGIPISSDSFTVWGWIAVVVGILLLAVGFSALHGSAWSRVIGAFIAGLALLANLVFLPVYPLWAIVAGVVSVLTIYALVVKTNSEA